MLNFPFYKEALGISAVLVEVSFFLITVLVLAILIKNKDTPIVKANNRAITYTLLVSLMLCLLCLFLYVGQPRMVTCLL